MTDFMAGAFAVITLIMLVQSFRLMSVGWGADKQDEEYKRKMEYLRKANEEYGGNVSVVNRTVNKAVHPEMKDVKNGARRGTPLSEAAKECVDLAVATLRPHCCVTHPCCIRCRAHSLSHAIS